MPVVQTVIFDPSGKRIGLLPFWGYSVRSFSHLQYLFAGRIFCVIFAAPEFIPFLSVGSWHHFDPAMWAAWRGVVPFRCECQQSRLRQSGQLLNQFYEVFAIN
ncbi:hypothetical protein OW567_04570, partial [Acidithiobacillus ferriphilus]|uniref:hypothetical protein n=1 Tax=Acidithiobacillus ferriphilus TaxID=1689834 RepID=UPI002DB9A22F